MISDNTIKYLTKASIICIGLFFACNKTIVPVIISDPADHNMNIIPSNPTSTDHIKLVVYDDCTYNILTGITLTDNAIQITKQFNSLMKMPCFMENDTIQIGILPQGSYIINYKLLDYATTPPKTALNLNFNLNVSQ